MEDSEIIALFYARGEQAIDALIKKHGAAVIRVARNILQNPLDAEECANDAYLAAWNTIPPQNPKPLRTYVCKLARNLALKRHWSNAAEKRGGGNGYDAALDELAEVLPAGETPETEYLAQELSAAISRFLDSVSYDDRFLFVRRYWYGDSVTDIGAMMGFSAHRVSVRLSRTRKRLKDYLKKEGLLA